MVLTNFFFAGVPQMSIVLHAIPLRISITTPSFIDEQGRRPLREVSHSLLEENFPDFHDASTRAQ